MQPGGTEVEWGTSLLAYADGVSLLGENVCTIKKKAESFLFVSKWLGLEVDTGKLSIYSCLVNRIQEKMAA
jgi:hypothetical protein